MIDLSIKGRVISKTKEFKTKDGDIISTYNRLYVVSPDGEYELIDPYSTNPFSQNKFKSFISMTVLINGKKVHNKATGIYVYHITTKST